MTGTCFPSQIPKEARSPVLPAQSSAAVRSAAINALELKKAIYHYGFEGESVFQSVWIHPHSVP